MFNNNSINQAQATTIKTVQNIDSYLGTTVKIEGNFSSDGNIQIDGEIKGGLNASKNVTIGEKALIVGNVKALNIKVSGAIEGNIKAKENLEILKTAKINGDIEAKTVSVEAGALITGSIKMHVTDIKETKNAPNNNEDYQLVSNVNELKGKKGLKK